MAHSTTRRMLLFVLGVLMLFCVTASGAGAQDRTQPQRLVTAAS